MKQNPTPVIFQFSEEIQNEYQTLMTSRESFSKNLTPAEQRKLAILYGQLEEAWLLNLTNVLSDNLNSKLNELNQLQGQIDQDWKSWKETTKEKFLIRLNQLKAKLNRDSATLNNNKSHLKNTLEDWKTDISGIEKDLLKKEEYLKELSESSLTRGQVEKHWEQSMKPVKEAYREIQKEFETISETSSKNKKILEDGLNSLKSKNLIEMSEIKFQNQQVLNIENEKLKMLESKLEKKLKASEKADQEKVEELKRNLKSLEMQQLKLLAKEILLETPNCPRELSQYLQLGDFSAVTLKEKTLTRDTNHILSLLEAELGKHGKNLQWFLSKYESAGQ